MVFLPAKCAFLSAQSAKKRLESELNFQIWCVQMSPSDPRRLWLRKAAVLRGLSTLMFETIHEEARQMYIQWVSFSTCWLEEPFQ